MQSLIVMAFVLVVFTPRGAWKLVVGQGSIAQRKTAPSCDGAVLVGESHLFPTKWSGEDEIRTKESLLADLMCFFEENPGWE